MRVYLITNTISGKQYIGQTTQTLASRWAQHLRDTRKSHLPLFSAIKKYGKPPSRSGLRKAQGELR